jgi:hypothetical protein
MSNHINETHTRSQAAEEILGQFYFALGQGAGIMRIQRSAITALRTRYAEPIAANVDHWRAAAPNVLAFVSQVGRLAAQLATGAGRGYIAEADFTKARQAVEAAVHSSGDRIHGIFAGPWCPSVATERPQETPTAETTDEPGAIAPRPQIAAGSKRVN